MCAVMASADERPETAPSRGRVASRVTPLDEIQERYLRRAISEVNELGDELLALGDELRVPVLGSGHPLGDIMLLKHAPTQSEIHEGVAFFGRAGQALLKSLDRLSVDPLAVYGTNCLKFGTEEPEQARACGLVAQERVCPMEVEHLRTASAKPRPHFSYAWKLIEKNKLSYTVIPAGVSAETTLLNLEMFREDDTDPSASIVPNFRASVVSQCFG